MMGGEGEISPCDWRSVSFQAVFFLVFGVWPSLLFFADFGG